ncbi:hypothetical protein Voc01_053540 [Virgisporangium ochraceum]|uniref:Glycerophosphoryl diester phosphodiesterase membrane domain-containing protein n=1 Tax=Virgisporangium ochraceum TaxID=65505 RepID=A0A8J4EFT8_9ACTN|nr:hypothetical protein Voc01_053540 [Virgisporangium ochraceum]
MPHGGYAVPPPTFGYPTGDPVFDPLISPDYNGWFSRATALVKAGWRPLAALQAIGVVAVMVVQLPVILWTVSVASDLSYTVEDDPTGTADLGPLFGVIGLALAGGFLSIVVAALVTLASIRVGVAVATGAEPNVGEALRGSMGRMFPLLGWQIVAGLLIVVGVCACVLPAIYLYVVFMTVPAVVAFERTNVISRCFQLFHRDLGAAVARLATILGFTIAASVLGGIIDAIISSATGASAGQFEAVPSDVTTGALIGGYLLSTLVAALIGAVAAVFTSQLTLTAYADLRARVEPLSTPVLASELGLQPPATAAGPAPTTW